jgi:ketosteroid isomerase-like protein
MGVAILDEFLDEALGDRGKLIAYCAGILAAAGALSSCASEGRPQFVGVSCPPSSATEAQQHQIRGTLEDWRDAYNRGDWPRTLDLVARDHIGWTEQGTTIDYAAQIRLAHERMAANAKPKGRYELQIDEIVVCGDMALVRDVWTFVRPADNGATIATPGRSVEFFRRQPDGSWKITRWIDAPAPPATAAK